MITKTMENDINALKQFTHIPHPPTSTHIYPPHHKFMMAAVKIVVVHLIVPAKLQFVWLHCGMAAFAFWLRCLLFHAIQGYRYDIYMMWWSCQMCAGWLWVCEKRGADRNVLIWKGRRGRLKQNETPGGKCLNFQMYGKNWDASCTN